jgi:hypothetical protein
MESVYLVSTGVGMAYVIQGIFRDKEVAETFAAEFDNATVNDEMLYREFPKLYRYECTMDLKTGNLLEIKKCSPSVSPMLLTLDGKTLYAVGETQAEAQYNAEAFFKKLQVLHIESSD